MLWNWLLKLTHFLKKSIACVNIAKLQSSISSLEMFTVCLNMEILSLSTFAFADRHVTHSSILSIILFYYVPYVLISSKCQKGSSLVSSLGYSNDFFVISQNLSSMLDINVYSIIVSKVLGAIVGNNFLFAIVVERFYNCKQVVEKKSCKQEVRVQRM